MVKVEKLKNGSTFIFEEIPDTKLVTVMVGVSVGSNNETEEENGLAHFFEHMCFKGTEKYKTPAELLSIISTLGVANASTSNDITDYYIKGLAKNLEEIIDVTSEMFIRSKFPVDELEKEKGVILQEYNMHEDNDYSKVEQLLVEQLFKGTPAGREIIGTKENIKRFSRDDFVAFLEKHYNTANAIITIVGDVKYEDAKRLTEQYFADIRKGPKSIKEEIKPARDTDNIVFNKKDREQITLNLGVPSVKRADKNYYSAKLLAKILAGGFSSRLWKELREKGSYCYDVCSIQFGYADYGHFTVDTKIEPDKLKEVMKIIIRELKKLKEEEVGAEELARFKESMIVAVNLKNENRFGGRPRKYMRDYVNLGVIEMPEETIEKIQKINSAEIKEVANKLLTKDKVKLAVVGPLNQELKPEIESILNEL
ncbi:MAG: pitrilysin family protein [Candidatus Campbellbacteria bacterium]|nr:pitrilysin family protein [Candidatus Campbellbacteria bacterium]